MKNISKTRGFTLIELLVVIAIIGILSAIVMTNLQNAKIKSRDAKRVSDIAQIQLALEQYFNKCSSYPSTLNSTNAADCAAHPNDTDNVTLSNYISTIPKDPKTASNYDYFVDSSNSNYDYVLHATFELPNSASLDGITNTKKPSYVTGKNCFDSSNPLEYCVGPK